MPWLFSGVLDPVADTENRLTALQRMPLVVLGFSVDQNDSCRALSHWCVGAIARFEMKVERST